MNVFIAECWSLLLLYYIEYEVSTEPTPYDKDSDSGNDDADDSVFRTGRNTNWHTDTDTQTLGHTRNELAYEKDIYSISLSFIRVYDMRIHFRCVRILCVAKEKEKKKVNRTRFAFDNSIVYNILSQRKFSVCYTEKCLHIIKCFFFSVSLAHL